MACCPQNTLRGYVGGVIAAGPGGVIAAGPGGVIAPGRDPRAYFTTLRVFFAEAEPSNSGCPRYLATSA